MSSDPWQLVLDNMGFGIHIAKRLGWMSDYRVSEIRSEVALALYSAAKTYDPKKGKFTTVAGYWVRKRLSETYRRRRNYVNTAGTWVRYAKVCSMDAALMRGREEDTQVPWDSYVGLQDRGDIACPACEREKGPEAALCRACQLRLQRHGACQKCMRPKTSFGCSVCCNSCFEVPATDRSSYCETCRGRKYRNGTCQCGRALKKKLNGPAYCPKCESENENV